MITFHKRSDKNNEITETNDRNEAIYFSIDNGSLHPISALTDEIVATNKAGNDIHLDVNGNKVVVNIPPSNENLPEPLLMPVMNFGDEDDEQVVQNDFDGLPMPKMTFNKPGKKQDKKVPASSNGNLPEPLPLPVMKF